MQISCSPTRSCRARSSSATARSPTIARGAARSGEDMEGDFLIPGLVELHTDHLEGHYAPRPKVRWNPIASVLAHDAQVATAGITTVFDALRVGMDYEADLGIEDMRKLADAIEDSVREDRVRADHFIHLRCEVSAPDCQAAFASFDDDDRVRLASLMDHAPGQRQFAELRRLRHVLHGQAEDVGRGVPRNIATSASPNRRRIPRPIARRSPRPAARAASCSPATTTQRSRMSRRRSSKASASPSSRPRPRPPPPRSRPVSVC